MRSDLSLGYVEGVVMGTRGCCFTFAVACELFEPAVAGGSILQALLRERDALCRCDYMTDAHGGCADY